MSKPNVLVSEEHKAMINNLMKDEIIIKMTHEIIPFFLKNNFTTALVDQYLSDWGVISSANKEYCKRGGTNSTTIGAPAEAIKRLIFIHLEDSNEEV